MSRSSQQKRQATPASKSSNPKRARPTPDRWARRQHCDVLHLSNTSAPACPPLALPADMPSAALDSDTSLLRASLHPLSVDEFKQQYWRRKAVAIVGAGSARVAELIAEELCGLDLKELMAESASEQIFVWMKERQADTDTSVPSASSSSASSLSALAKQPITSFPLDNPTQLDAALACYNSGSSLYFRSPPALAHRFVRAFNSGVGFNFAGLDYSSTSSSSQPKGEIEVFVSRAGHHTGFHSDFMDNFTIQLSGTKTWMFGAVDVQYPVRGFTPHYKDRSTDEMQYKVHTLCQGQQYAGAVPDSGDQVTLSAGDVLYHPAGIWHAVSCDEDSISINISLIATTPADLISDAVRQLLWRTEAGRAGLCGTDSEMRSQVQQALLALQSAVSTSLTPSDILPAAMRAPRPPQPPTIDIDVDERMYVNGGDLCSLTARFRVNPLMTVTPHRGRMLDEDGEEGDEAEEWTERELMTFASSDELKEADDDQDGSEAEAEGEERKEEQNGHEESDSEGSQDDPEYAPYVIHHLFGNDSLDSAMRSVLRVHPNQKAAFDMLTSAAAASASAVPDKGTAISQVVQLLPGGTRDGHHANVARCAFVLHELGYLQWL